VLAAVGRSPASNGDRKQAEAWPAVHAKLLKRSWLAACLVAPQSTQICLAARWWWTLKRSTAAWASSWRAPTSRACSARWRSRRWPAAAAARCACWSHRHAATSSMPATSSRQGRHPWTQNIRAQEARCMPTALNAAVARMHSTPAALCRQDCPRKPLSPQKTLAQELLPERWLSCACAWLLAKALGHNERGVTQICSTSSTNENHFDGGLS
jgi:hypothetical protein